MIAEDELFAGVQEVLDCWDAMSDAQRMRMPPDVIEAIVKLREILNGTLP